MVKLRKNGKLKVGRPKGSVGKRKSIGQDAYDALLHLKHAKRAMIKSIRDGEVDDLSEDQLLSLLALKTLERRA